MAHFCVNTGIVGKLDDMSRYVQLYFTKSYSGEEVKEALHSFRVKYQCLTKFTLMRIRSDQHKSFKQGDMATYCKTNSIFQDFSLPYEH